MSTFNRGLDDAFVEALNQEYDKGGWWRRFVCDQDVFLAIRENRVDAYYRGCLLISLSWRRSTCDFVGKIHYKYLLHPDLHNKYITVKEDGKVALSDDTTSWFLNDLSDIGNLKKAVKRYAGDEKRGVHDVVKANANILDVEIAFGGRARLDFAALQNSGEGARIVFFEAKHFDNTELRAQGNDEPKVVKQIEAYSLELVRNGDAILSAYRRVCSNLLSLDGVVAKDGVVANRYLEHHTMLKSVVDGSLTIDKDPVLIVFGYDRDQMERWKNHREKLEKRLPKRVHFQGKSKGFTRGISARPPE